MLLIFLLLLLVISLLLLLLLLLLWLYNDWLLTPLLLLLLLLCKLSATTDGVVDVDDVSAYTGKEFVAVCNCAVLGGSVVVVAEVFAAKALVLVLSGFVCVVAVGCLHGVAYKAVVCIVFVVIGFCI